MTLSRRAFTLVELLVVVAIIVILIAILVPSLEKAMAASYKAKCGSNLSGVGKGIGTALNDSIARAYMAAADDYSLFGKMGVPAPNTNNENQKPTRGSDRRPLNKYLGIQGANAEVKVAECPSDSGDSWVDPDGMSSMNQTGWSAMGMPLPADPSGQNIYGTLGPNSGGNVTPTYNYSGQMGAGTSNVYNCMGNSYVGVNAPMMSGVQGAFMATGGMRASDAKPAASKILVGDSPFLGDRKYSDRRNRWHSADKTVRAFNILFADYHVEFYTFPDYQPNGGPWGAGSRDIEQFGHTAGDAKLQRGYW